MIYTVPWLPLDAIPFCLRTDDRGSELPGVLVRLALVAREAIRHYPFRSGLQLAEMMACAGAAIGQPRFTVDFAIDVLRLAEAMGLITLRDRALPDDVDPEFEELTRFLSQPPAVGDVEAEARLDAARRLFPDAMRRVGLL